MQYVSTRGVADELNFEGVTLTGLARDGGLYVPAAVPTLDAETFRRLRGRPYADVAFAVLQPFVGDSLTAAELRGMVDATYGDAFHHPAVAPLVQVDRNDWILELFHGPTLAFKDFALQLLGRLFDAFTARRGGRLTILGATSGDTGSAAIAGCRGRDAVTIFMLHPHGRVSEVQRRQMTTVLEPNVVNIAIDGTFDDCQALVKAAFNDLDFRDGVSLTAVNSINWARVLAQVVYYVSAAVSLGAPDRPVSFSVPTGNFGDIFAGYIARAMGLPVARLVIATNSNDILARTLKTGRYDRAGVHKTLSPSMDIQVASNFERLLFDLKGRSGNAVSAAMEDLATQGGFALSPDERGGLAALFAAERLDDGQTSRIMADTYGRSGYLADPHTAVGLGAARACLDEDGPPRVTLATAHPAKFPDAVAAATGVTPALPSHMGDLMQAEERFETLPNDLAALKRRMLDHLSGVET